MGTYNDTTHLVERVCVCVFLFLVTDGAEPASAHYSCLIWPSNETDYWDKLGS